MNEIKKMFAEYGADYTSTMERFLYNESMYLRFLDMLFQDDNLQKLEMFLVQGDVKGAFEAAHTLKGVVGNMGLTPLYNVICIIVEPLRAGEIRNDYMDLYRDIQIEFEKAAQFRDSLKKLG